MWDPLPQETPHLGRYSADAAQELPEQTHSAHGLDRRHGGTRQRDALLSRLRMRALRPLRRPPRLIQRVHDDRVPAHRLPQHGRPVETDVDETHQKCHAKEHEFYSPVKSRARSSVALVQGPTTLMPVESD